MESIQTVPLSLREVLSKELVKIVLSTKDKNAVSADKAKRIIYLWRQDQLSTIPGLSTLLEVSTQIDIEATRNVLESYNILELVLTV